MTALLRINRVDAAVAPIEGGMSDVDHVASAMRCHCQSLAPSLALATFALVGGGVVPPCAGEQPCSVRLANVVTQRIEVRTVSRRISQLRRR
jgi:hypothetical protein